MPPLSEDIGGKLILVNGEVRHAYFPTSPKNPGAFGHDASLPPRHVDHTVGDDQIHAGLTTAALAWYGIRRGELWACVTAIAAPVLGLAVALPVPP
jgi:hypothetical protein